PDSAQAVAAFAFKPRELAKNPRAHLGLSHLLRIRRLGRRHRFFYFGAEIREPHRRKRDPEHSTLHFHARRVLPFWRSVDAALLPLRGHRHSGGNLFVSRASHAHRRIIRESWVEPGNRLRVG